jgi:hypothetical protein
MAPSMAPASSNATSRPASSVLVQYQGAQCKEDSPNMWLIHTETFELHQFEANNRPPYAILSHTWDRDEVTFQELSEGGEHIRSKLGFRKIECTCIQARGHGLDYVWIDTCCIDKRSSAELTEAINSMFSWYRQAYVCYACLDDMLYDGNRSRPELEELGSDTATNNGAAIVNSIQETEKDELHKRMANSRWSTRGWTLQELIAPVEVNFYDSQWHFLGRRSDASMRKILSDATGIPASVLADSDGTALMDIPIATRMSWASRRETTREEDMAYCLMGLFDVNIPIVYGEGGKKAFRRLQLEIMRQTADQSIFAWDYSFGFGGAHRKGSVLADSPRAFVHSSSVSIWGMLGFIPSRAFEMTNMGLRISVPLSDLNSPSPLALLECGVVDKDRQKQRCAIPLELCQKARGQSPAMYVRSADGDLMTRQWEDVRLVTWRGRGSGKEQNPGEGKVQDIVIMEPQQYAHWRKLRERRTLEDSSALDTLHLYRDNSK